MKPTPFAFFLEHAGYSYQPATESVYAGRVHGALELAAAEANASHVGASHSWQIDPDTDSSDRSDDPDPWCVWMCTMRNESGIIIESLSGIDFGRDGEPWNDPYRRVVEAELALAAGATEEWQT